ncbi:MAG TPA: CsbD family protein [Acidimicrobiales bacterium]|nr:CsbD family protein [Acidimicrobiales bacterium]
MAEIRDRTRNKAQQAKGKAKEVAGQATGDRDLDAKGRADRKKGKAKQAGENVKDAVRR